jgi:hypothetical protein
MKTKSGKCLPGEERDRIFDEMPIDGECVHNIVIAQDKQSATTVWSDDDGNIVTLIWRRTAVTKSWLLDGISVNPKKAK